MPLLSASVVLVVSAILFYEAQSLMVIGIFLLWASFIAVCSGGDLPMFIVLMLCLYSYAWVSYRAVYPLGKPDMLTKLNALLEVRERIERRRASIKQALEEARCKGEFGRVSELESEQSEVTACLEAADWHIDWLEGFSYPRS